MSDGLLKASKEDDFYAPLLSEGERKNETISTIG
jgi:hypothetical protein